MHSIIVMNHSMIVVSHRDKGVACIRFRLLADIGRPWAARACRRDCSYHGRHTCYVMPLATGNTYKMYKNMAKVPPTPMSMTSKTIRRAHSPLWIELAIHKYRLGPIYVLRIAAITLSAISTISMYMDHVFHLILRNPLETTRFDPPMYRCMNSLMTVTSNTRKPVTVHTYQCNTSCVGQREIGVIVNEWD